MNKHTSAQIDLARKMLKGRIEVSEVIAMTDLSEATVLELQEEVEKKRKADLQGLNIQDFDKDGIIFDNIDQ